MTAELGDSVDSEDLVPGNVDAVNQTVAALRRYGDALHRAGNGLRRLDTTEGWSGQAAEDFRAAFEGSPSKWLRAGDDFHEAAQALEIYGATLTWAQSQAAEALRQWSAGHAASEQARAEHDEAAQAADRDLPFHDPGLIDQDAAQHTLARARSQLQEAGDRAAAVLRAAEDQAPGNRDFLDEFADGASQVVDAVATWFSAHGDELGSALQHGGETALGALGMLGGGAVVAAGFGGEIGGTLASATGVGAAAGVPVDVASAGVIMAGGAIAAGGAGLAADGIQGLAHDTNQMFADSGNRYYPPPKGKNLPNVPGATRAKPKTPVQGGGGLRPRWKDPKGKIYEWDSQHGEIEKYSKRGKHEGVLDPDTGKPIPGKGPETGREVEP